MVCGSSQTAAAPSGFGGGSCERQGGMCGERNKFGRFARTIWMSGWSPGSPSRSRPCPLHQDAATGCESNRLVCSSLSFPIPFCFSISKAQAHPHNQLLSGWLPRCDIYRVYWKLLAHYWASKWDCFSKKEISRSVGLVASLDCKQREPEVGTKLHCFFYLQKQFAALCFLSDS